MKNSAVVSKTIMSSYTFQIFLLVSVVCVIQCGNKKKKETSKGTTNQSKVTVVKSAKSQKPKTLKPAGPSAMGAPKTAVPIGVGVTTAPPIQGTTMMSTVQSTVPAPPPGGSKEEPKKDKTMSPQQRRFLKNLKHTMGLTHSEKTQQTGESDKKTGAPSKVQNTEPHKGSKEKSKQEESKQENKVEDKKKEKKEEKDKSDTKKDVNNPEKAEKVEDEKVDAPILPMDKVQKKGLLDDFIEKTKDKRIKDIEDMKTEEDSKSKQANGQKVTFNEKKCELWETKEQATVDDDEQDNEDEN